MGWNRKLLSLVVAVFLFIGFQNCNPVKFRPSEEPSLSKIKSDNGSVFDGKPTFYLTRPNFTCEGKQSPLAQISWTDTGPQLTFNQNDYCGAISNQPLSPSDIDTYAFDPDFLGYRDGIYERTDGPPDLSSPVYNEAWCQSTGQEPSVSLIVKVNSEGNLASSQIRYSANGNANSTSSFQVSRNLDDVSADYQAAGFHLRLDRSQPAPQKWWYFEGQLETDKVSGAWKGSVLCRMAASKLLANVEKVYPQNSDWNSYVRFSDLSKDTTAQADVSCGSASSWKECFHSGDKMQVETELKNCASLTIKDQLNSFQWACEDSPEGATFKALRFRAGKSLSSLVSKNGWKPNFIQVTQNGRIRYESIPLPWWKNPVMELKPDTTGAALQLSVAKAVYVADASLRVPGIQIKENGVSVVLQNGAVVTGTANMSANCNLTGVHFSAPDNTFAPSRCLLTSEDHDYIWIEGSFDVLGSNATTSINLQKGQFLRLQNVKARSASTGFGVFQENVRASIYDSLIATGNHHGLVSGNSVGNLFSSSDFSNNASTGLWLTAWDNQNTILYSQALKNGITGFAFNSAKDVTMVSSRTGDNVVRGIEITGFTENARLESVIVSGDSYGIDIQRSGTASLQPNTFKDTALISRTLGLRVYEGAGTNKEVFTGQLFLVSANTCSVTKEPAITTQSCPGFSQQQSDVFALPTTVLNAFSPCGLASGGSGVLCQNGKSWAGQCRVQDTYLNPLINAGGAVNAPACSTQVFK